MLLKVDNLHVYYGGVKAAGGGTLTLRGSYPVRSRTSEALLVVNKRSSDI